MLSPAPHDAQPAQRTQSPWKAVFRLPNVSSKRLVVPPSPSSAASSIITAPSTASLAPAPYHDPLRSSYNSSSTQSSTESQLGQPSTPHYSTPPAPAAVHTVRTLPPQHPALGPYAALAPPPHAPHPRALPVRLRLAPPALPHQQRAPEPQVGRRDCLSLHPPRGVCPQRQGPLLHGLSLHRDDQERSARPRRVRAPHAAACLEFIRSGAGVLARDRLIRVVQRANVPSVGAGSAQSQRRCQPARSAPGPAKDCLPPDVLKQLDQSSPGRAPQCYNTPLLIRSQVEVGPSSFSKIKMLGKGDVGRVYLVREKKTSKLYAMKGTLALPFNHLSPSPPRPFVAHKDAN